MYNTEFIKQEERIVVSTRQNISASEWPNLIGVTFGKLVEYIGKEQGNVAGYPFTAYHGIDEDGKLDENNIDVEIGFPVLRKIKETDEIKCYTEPQCEVISCTYKGSYSNLAELYKQMTAEAKSMDAGQRETRMNII